MNGMQTSIEEASSSANSVLRRLAAQTARPEGLTVRAVIDRYMAQYAGADMTRSTRLGAWSAMIGDFRLDQVDGDVIHAGRAELATQPPVIFMGLDYRGHRIFKKKPGGKPKSQATLNRYLVALAAVFTWAIEERLTPKGWANPCRGIKRLREPDGRVRFLDEAERERLFAAAKLCKYPRMHALVLMAMLTGARHGELMSLRWRDVDLEAGRVSLGRTKNGDRRVLVLLPQVVQALQPFKSSEGARFVFGSVRSKYQQPASIQTAWRATLDRAEIRDFHFHDLRHCCASYMAQAGTPLNIIADVLGHRRLDMTKRYAHLTTQTKATAMHGALGNIGAGDDA